MPKSPPNRMIEAAETYLDRGLPIAVCDGKAPTGIGWQKAKPNRRKILTALKRGGNIGLVINQTDWIDVEADSDEAEAALQELFGGAIPLTPTWTSQRGKHRLFVRPEGLPERAVVRLDGIEFKIGNGKGAFSVLPPRVHPLTGRLYKWDRGRSLDDVAPAELPLHIIKQLKNTRSASKTKQTANSPIPQGKRNDALFGKALSLRSLGLTEDLVTSTLLELNTRLCKPPLDKKEVEQIARSAMKSEPTISFLDRLLGDCELWHDENMDPYVTLPQGKHRENWLIGKRSRAFRRWLSKMFYDATSNMLGAGELAEIASLLEGKAVFDGSEFQLFRRTAEHDGKIYLDLCDEGWRAVEVDTKGWRIISDPPVKFRRAKAMHPLPPPVDTEGSRLHDLLGPFLNILDSQWPLVATWLVAALRPRGPYPVLKLLGEQGSAKTTLARILRSVLDPNAAPVRAEPRSTRDLMIASNNGWLLCLDNLFAIKPDLSDALCRLATGGGFATRTLYTDEDETIFDAQRPTVITSIEEIGTRSDLLERSLIIELPAIREGKRRAEKAFWAAFEKLRPKILGALLCVVSGAMKRLPEIERRTDVELPRLADFHQWGEAAEASLGLEPGTFAEAYIANRESVTEIALQSNPAVVALLRFLKKNREVEDTTQGLLDKLKYIDSSLTDQAGWPKTASVLSAILKRSAPNLRQIGIRIEQYKRGSGDSKRKVWCIVGPTDSTDPDTPGRVGRVGRHSAKSFSPMAAHLQSKSAKRKAK